MTDEPTNSQRPRPDVVETPTSALIEGVYYPDSDGHFLPPYPLQQRPILDVRLALGHHFHGVKDVVLEGNMFFYYEEGNPRANISPDVFVVLNHDLGRRGTYKLWEEGKPPDFALDVVSPESEISNRADQRDLYERLGIGEYFLFQPNIQQQGRRLLGYRLRGNTYEEVEPEPDDGLLSLALGVDFRVEGAKLRLRKWESGHEYLWVKERAKLASDEFEARQQAEARRAELEARRRAAGL